MSEESVAKWRASQTEQSLESFEWTTAFPRWMRHTIDETTRGNLYDIVVPRTIGVRCGGKPAPASRK